MQIYKIIIWLQITSSNLIQNFSKNFDVFVKNNKIIAIYVKNLFLYNIKKIEIYKIQDVWKDEFYISDLWPVYLNWQ